MRILMVHPHDIFSSVEPWTRRITSFAAELSKNGHQVKLVYFPLGKASSVSSFIDGYEAVPFRRITSPEVFIRNICRMVKFCSWADIVHFQKGHYYSAIPVVFAAYLKRKPLHYDWDDWEEMIWYESSEKGIHRLLIGLSFKILERLLPFLADTVSVSSQHLKNLAKKFGAKEDKIYLIPVGADLQEFNPNVDGSQVRKKYNINSPLVLYIGQLHGAQYINLLIKAANVVLHKNPEVIFMIVGGGFMEGELKELAREFGIAHRIIFTGSLPQDQIPAYIAAANVCVAPFEETKVTRCKSPLKIVEYMACGKPIVASNVGEVRRMLGGTAVLVDPGNCYYFGEGILKILEDKALSDGLGRFVRERAERVYNWPKTVSLLSKAYEKLYKSL